jgi:hypothetical protein
VPTGDFGAELAALLVKAGKSARDGDAASRAAAENAEDAAEKAQVDSLRQKASDIRREGWTDGISLAGEGACALAGAASSSSTAQGVWKAAGISAEAGGKFVGGGYKADQATDDANAASHEADADHAKRAADDENEEMKNERDFINAAVDFYKQYSDTKAQERAAVTHGS